MMVLGVFGWCLCGSGQVTQRRRTFHVVEAPALCQSPVCSPGVGALAVSEDVPCSRPALGF